MNEGITPEQFKVLSALRKEAKEVIKAEYIDVLKSSWLQILKIDYGEPDQQYYIIFKLNGETHTIKIDKHKYMIALKQNHPSKAINFICDIIADKLTKIFLTEVC